MNEFPEARLRPGWTDEVDVDSLPDEEASLVAIHHPESNAYADIIDVSTEDEISIYVVRAVPDLTEMTDFILLNSVLDPSDAVDILEQFMAQVDIAIEDGETVSWAIETLTHEYAPKNEDSATGHPVESLLAGHTMAIGPVPETICFASGKPIRDSLVHTPRVMCYASGRRQNGWAPLAFFHESTQIATVQAAREVLPECLLGDHRDELLLSGLAIALDFNNGLGYTDLFSHDAFLKRLEFRDPALRDEEPI